MKAFELLYKVFWVVREFFVSLFFILFVFLGFLLVGLMNDDSAEKTKRPTEFKSGALVLNLNGYLADNRDEYRDLYRLIDDSEPEKIASFDVANALWEARDDDNITGLVLDLGKLQGADYASLEYIGSWISNFQNSGKPVIAVGNAYTQAQYYLASFADEIYLNPAGFVGVQGVNYSNLYFKGLLDKLDAVPHIFRVGTYKSAVEPFIRNDMSPAARENATRWVGQLWQNYLEAVARNRGVKSADILPAPDRLIRLFKQAGGDEAQYALRQKLVTKLATGEEMRRALIAKFGENREGDFNRIDFDDYAETLDDRFDVVNEPKIAVVNVEGEIALGKSEDGTAGSTSVVNALRKAGKDKNVRALILRVNSPGGSAMASELIRQAVSDLQEKGILVVTSMGGMAASGGYWIAATSDGIVASPQTITGSIGIFGLSVSFEKTAKKIGVNEDGISTSPMAEMSALKPINADQATLMQMSVESGYDKFLNLVSKGRKMPKAKVDSLAQGQVWLGTQALENGLVDELGDFDTAVGLVNEQLDERNKKAGKPKETYALQWFEDEDDSSLGSLVRRFKLQTQVRLTQWLDLPVAKKLHTQTALLSKLNDPKSLYLYCLNCGEVK